jgi:hypothetical protein
MLRQVRGSRRPGAGRNSLGTALTDGRGERVVRPGATVAADTVLLELSNPQTEQAAMTAELDLKSAKAQFEVLKADLQKDLWRKNLSRPAWMPMPRRLRWTRTPTMRWRSRA